MADIQHIISGGEGISQAIQAELEDQKIVEKGQQLGVSIWNEVVEILKEDNTATIQHKENAARKIGDEWQDRWSTVKTYVGDVVKIAQATWDKIVAAVKKGLGITEDIPPENPENVLNDVVVTASPITKETKQNLSYTNFNEVSTNKLDKDRKQGISRESTQTVYKDAHGHQRIVIKDKNGNPYRVSEYSPKGELMYERELKDGKWVKTKGNYNFKYQAGPDFTISPAEITAPSSEEGKVQKWVYCADGSIHSSSGLEDGSIVQPKMDAYAGSARFQNLKKPVADKTKTEKGITREYDEDDNCVSLTTNTSANGGIKEGTVTRYTDDNNFTSRRSVYRDEKGNIYRILEYENNRIICQKDLGDDGKWTYNNDDIRFIYYFPTTENPDTQVTPRVCVETLTHKTNKDGKSVAATKRLTFYTREGIVDKVEEVICNDEGRCQYEILCDR